jgi:predicted permease
MIRNYFILAFRNVRKHKAFSFINVLGLAIGISASLVIFLLVQYENGFDQFHADRNRIYRVVTALNYNGTPYDNSGVCAPLPAAARTTLPGIETAVAFHTMYDPKVSIIRTNTQQPEVFKARKGVIFTDQHYFSLFSHTWIAGSPDVLKQPFAGVLTESRAREYFSLADPAQAIGQRILYDDSIEVTVAGIVKDITQRTDLNFKEFISLATIPAKKMEEALWYNTWNNYNSSSQFYVKLKQGASPQQVATLATALVAKNSPQIAGISAKNLLQPLSDLHFSTVYENYGQRKAHKPTLNGLLIVAGFLLLLGCINFINLTTAQAAQRAKETGIRKTMGGTRWQLMSQFLSETFALTIIATLLSIILVPFLLKIFSGYLPEGVAFNQLLQPGILAFIGALVVVVGLVSGFYPALVLSRFKPVQVLKNQANAGSGKTRTAWLRKTLTVSQFIIAQFFIIGTLMVSKQIHFSLNKDLGYRKDAIINFTIPWRELNASKKQVLLEKFRSIPEIKMVSLSGIAPASKGFSSTNLSFDDGKKTVDKQVEIRLADADYFNLYQLKLVAGKMLQPSDTVTKEYIVNEAYAREMGYAHPADIVGKFIKRGNDKTALPIVGVVADFHTQSLHQAIKPLAFHAKSKDANTFHILLPAQQAGANTWKQALTKIDQALKELYPQRSFDYAFFDEQIAAFYKTEQSMAGLLTWASALAVIISCLGLLGLVIYTTHQRVKEIGVRKVLGASVTHIISLLSKDFVVLVILAFVITAPLAGWAAKTWLQNFAYRTSVSWWIFAAGGAIMLLIALLTVSIQTVRAALANPVKALRTE